MGTPGLVKSMRRGLPPVVDDQAGIVILGTLPGEESLRKQQYYADPSNQFWSLLARTFDAPVGTTYPDHLNFLATHGVALWDVLESAERKGSSDSAIKRSRPNDFDAFFTKFPQLRRIAFNGTKAEALWRTHIRPRPGVPHRSLMASTLPSSSGTPGRYVLPFDDKVARWRECLRPPG
jgi:hypoxanthine-DNA glycosylase